MHNLLIVSFFVFSNAVFASGSPGRAGGWVPVGLIHKNERGESACTNRMTYYDWGNDLEIAQVRSDNQDWFIRTKLFNHTREDLKYKTWDGRNWTARVINNWNFRHCLNGKGPCHDDNKLEYITRGSGKIELTLKLGGCDDTPSSTISTAQQIKQRPRVRVCGFHGASPCKEFYDVVATERLRPSGSFKVGAVEIIDGRCEAIIYAPSGSPKPRIRVTESNRDVASTLGDQNGPVQPVSYEVNCRDSKPDVWVCGFHWAPPCKEFSDFAETGSLKPEGDFKIGAVRINNGQCEAIIYAPPGSPKPKIRVTDSNRDVASTLGDHRGPVQPASYELSCRSAQ